VKNTTLCLIDLMVYNHASCKIIVMLDVRLDKIIQLVIIIYKIVQTNVL